MLERIRSLFSRDNLDLLVVSLLVIALVMFDVTLDLVAGLLHFGVEVIHITYEWIELGIEHSVEHLFHTDRHGSQLVTFYILISIAAFGGYQLWKALPRIGNFLLNFALSAWVKRSTQLTLYWNALTLVHQITVVVTALVVAVLASFFVM